MGMRRNAEIEAWQKAHSIEPATGHRAELLCQISEAAFELIKVIELERSGIRDGDGFWSGSDVLGGTIGNLSGLAQKLDQLDRGKWRPLTPKEIEDCPF